jgi:hypothetical protein
MPHIGGHTSAMAREKTMKGKFKSYDENTGRGTIWSEDRVFTPPPTHFTDTDKSDESHISVSVQYPMHIPGREYFFIVPEEHKHKMNIKLGTAVEFDPVQEGSEEVTHLRF